MKKIYLSFAFMATMVLGVNAQNNKTVMSQDVQAGLNFPSKHINLSGVQTQKGPGSGMSITACDTLGTRWAGGNSQNGNMFDLVNTSSVAIQITGFDQCFATIGTADSVYILYKSGTFVGSEATASAWTLGGQVYMTPSMSLTPINIPVTLTVSIPAGGTYGFYITRTGTNYVAYTNGTGFSTTLKAKNGLGFQEGKGVAFPFGSTFGGGTTSRIWNGIISYCTPLITGINNIEINEEETNVYPNPSVSKVNVNITNAIGVENATANIYDMAGRLVYSQANINVNNFEVNHNLTSGIYVMKVENKGVIVLNKKLSVQ
jgi:hypothetical protein